MNHKDDRIIGPDKADGLDGRYVAYFDCFNRQRYFEAHEVLEKLWLQERGGARERFYKGLIQVAGAFVHVQKDRRGPAGSLLRLARSNLLAYPGVYEAFSVQELAGRLAGWIAVVESTREWPAVRAELGTPILALRDERGGW